MIESPDVVIAGGAAIWTTHFIAMLGLQIPMAHTFDPLMKVGSLLIAIAFASIYLYVLSYRETRAQLK